MSAIDHSFDPGPAVRVGVVGTGYVSDHFVRAFDEKDGLHVTSVLTRRPPASLRAFPRADLLTQNVEELVDRCDVLFECTGDPVHAADVIGLAMDAGLPVVTMNAEFHITAGSYFSARGLLTEARGDQPGSLAALNRRAEHMGFRPLAFVNMKAFLDLDPSLENMHFWAQKKSITLDKVVSFTDGTKLQIEQALVANGLDADIGLPGMHGLRTADLAEAAEVYGERAREMGTRLSDYILFAGAPHGVFIVAEHDDDQAGFLTHIKMGDGPFYVLTDQHVLVHLEVARTIRKLLREGSVLLNNSSRPRVNVAAIAKRDLPRGLDVPQAIGSFAFRGSAVRILDEPDAVPIGLLERARLVRPLEAGQVVRFDDVELPESLAHSAWMWVLRRVEASGRPASNGHGLHRNGHPTHSTLRSGEALRIHPSASRETGE